MKIRIFIYCGLFILAGGINLQAEDKAAPDKQNSAPLEIDFNRDIRPILSQNCFTCHGPDEAQRATDLRLDTAEGAYQVLDVHPAVQPGHPDSSLLIQRINSTDEDELMPPVDSDLKLTEREIKLLTEWIRQGGQYEEHWAFQPITRPALPEVSQQNWGRNEIDAFVLRRLEQAKLTPSSEANRHTLIRRLFLDLTGLPPTPEQVEQFVQDKSENAYEKLVETALASQHYGEKWGKHWLDQARYADTNGYTIDSERTMWPWRDWVIKAINDDMPFDQFTVEQIAGDQLESPTREQLVATGFHRNTLINQEGGTDDEQFRNEAVVDRVNTTGAVWLGLTINCAQCHTHKYDPVTQHDFYRLFAFFNQNADVNSTSPTLRLSTPEQELKLGDYDKQIKTAQAKLNAYNKENPPPESEGDKKDKEKSPEDSERKKLSAAVKKLQSARKSLVGQIPHTMIMRDLEKARETHVLIRGDFLRHGDPVSADTIEILPSLVEAGVQVEEKTQPNRLALAKWLVSPQNPLTARVTVNRIWMRYFGTGLVETENDFGMQGTPPSHPQLLDWLASDFMENGWSLKHLHRTIVSSATYRQSSLFRDDLEKVDPLNKLLGRQVRIRVDAEQVRDIALATSGLLSTKIGGPSVYPPQPEGVYSFTQRAPKWPTSEGEDRYRRGMYTFFMRSAPYPMLTTFDVPRFNTTCTRRTRSNTPLQSLTMANDETMLEFAQALGRRLAKQLSNSDNERIDYGYLLCFSRYPDEVERNELLNFLAQQRREFENSPEAATKIVGDKVPEGVSVNETAAWTTLARVLMNLDEFITRE